MSIYLGAEDSRAPLSACEAERARRAEIARAMVAFMLAFVCAFGCAPTLASRVIQAGVVAANVADVHSTKLAIESTRGQEGNPLLPDSWIAQGVIHAFGAAGVIWIGTTLEVRGHRTLARVFQGAVAAGFAVVAARNYNIAR
jgi:hypothetical protein